MNCMMIFMAAATLGVDVGWQRQQNGELEYIIQIEPQLIESLKEGKVLTSGIRPALRGIRRYRIVVGTGKLARIRRLASVPRGSILHRRRSGFGACLQRDPGINRLARE